MSFKLKYLEENIDKIQCTCVCIIPRTIHYSSLLNIIMQATDKLKSEEELAKEEKERLDKLEVNYLP